MQKPTNQQELLRLIDRAADEGWTELDLAGLGLEELPKEIGKCTQLRTLTLGKIRKWEWIEHEKGRVAQYSTNRLRVLPDSVQELGNIQFLNLSGNPFGGIPASVFQLRNLRVLTGDGIGLQEIPEEIKSLRNLIKGAFHKNNISMLPDFLIEMPKLTVLDLSENRISIVPDSIVQYENLSTLILYNNKISEISSSICKIPNLMRLNLGNNRISEIPESIIFCENIFDLSLSGNQISRIPEEVFQLNNLIGLYLAGNYISIIPESISQLEHLVALSLANNQVRVIPDSIGCLSRLNRLYLSENLIEVIPDSLSKLRSLNRLTLGDNRISVIPEFISDLEKIERLDLSGNNISSLPECLENLPELKNIDLRRNTLPIPPELLGSADMSEPCGNPSAIFNYLRELHKGDRRPLNEAKVLLIGQGSVGKTSVINRLINGNYNAMEEQTDGLAITKWNINVNTKDVRLNIWDFGGQEIYHATHQFFLTKRSLYLLIANCRTTEEENRLDYWLKLIDSLADSAPVIIIGNKSDEQPLDLNQAALRRKYPNIKAILETSCQTGEGIPELRTAITQEIGNLREVYDLLPESWFNLKQQLESLDQDFISLSQYATQCALQGITTEADQNQLSDLLHNLGIILNFRHHPILQTTNILNPHWVTNGIYSILSDSHLKTETHGILTPQDLTRILPDDRYPQDRHHCLTHLMQEFQLCFPLNDSGNFLIPALLPKEQPENTDLPGDTLAFQYHYPILPDSILSRFIVLSSDKIHNATYWRTGVLLAYRENHETYNLARITSDPIDRIITIAINGRENTRRAFLTLLRDTLTRIHNSFANLEATEFVPVPDHSEAEPLDYQELLGLEDMGEKTVLIGKLKLRIDLRQLLDGYESVEQRQTRRMRDHGNDIYGREYNDLVEITKLAVSRPIHNTANATMNPDTSTTNNLQGAQIGNFANMVKDSATQTASNFTQTHNANTTELLQLLITLRQTATQFPTEIQEGVIIDIEDLETEIQKAEDNRSPTRLKRSLIALLTAATMIAAPIAGITDFTNNVLEIGNKLHIEIPQIR